MDYLDVDMRLPPRKRLLAGLRRDKSFADALPPIPLFSSDIGARIRDVISSPTSTPEDIVEVSKSVAAAAVEIATAAKDTAMQKAAAAAKARAAAKNALEFLDSITGDRRPKRRLLGKNKLRKEVPIKLFYKTQNPASDEELARKLHRAMNSSPRISNNKQKKVSSSIVDVASDDGDLSSRNVPTHDDGTLKMTSGTFLDNLEEKIVVCSEVSTFEEEEDEKEELWPKKTKKNLSKPREVAGRRKLKTKRKKLSLSQCDDSEQKGRAPVNDASAIAKISSIWKCKKLKMTQCSSDNKILPALC